MTAALTGPYNQVSTGGPGPPHAFRPVVSTGATSAPGGRL
jgi:hypothetical protein